MISTRLDPVSSARNQATQLRVQLPFRKAPARQHRPSPATCAAIGKMGIPDSILLKPGSLTTEEWAIMRRHPSYAQAMLSPIPYLWQSLDIPYSHHERRDGSGYPRGLKGELIPLAARIFAVVDVWDALTSNRPYRPAWGEEEALAYIRDQAGKHFDPAVVNIFLENYPEWTKS